MGRTIDVTGNLMDDIYALLNAYKALPSDVISVEVKTVGTQSEPPAVRVSEGGSSVVGQLADALKERFPKLMVPPPPKLREICAAAGNDWELLDDLLLGAAEYNRKTQIGSIGGFLLNQLKQAGGDFTSIRANAERIRSNDRADNGALIAGVMKQAETKIAKLPARTGPNTSGANRLKSLKIGGADNLERAEGSAEAS